MRDRLDLTIGGGEYRRGHLHPVTRIWRELEDVFVGLGYKVAEGPEVELDWYNFEALNFPPGHPARAMQDTLYVRLGEPEQVLLRTHTSPVQVRTMEAQKPPIYVVAPGRVFRRDTLDARHSPVFHQIEGPRGRRRHHARRPARHHRGVHPRAVRPEHQRALPPVVLPVHRAVGRVRDDVRVLRGRRLHACARGRAGSSSAARAWSIPNVFEAVDIDPERYTGFAFGFGIDRVAQLLYGIDHVKNVWDGDVRFLPAPDSERRTEVSRAQSMPRTALLDP